MDIRLDPLDGPEIATFLEQHLEDMRAVSPPESKHALDLEGLRAAEVSFWSVFDGSTLVGCGALKALDPRHAELKSMRVAVARRGQGVGAMLLGHLLQQARARGFRRVSLETGSMPFFAPARRLYERHGFVCCAPFGEYREDPNSVYMSRLL